MGFSWSLLCEVITLLITLGGFIFGFVKFSRSFKQLKSEHSNRIKIEESNRRQVWVDQFRNEIAEYFNNINEIMCVDEKKEINLDKLYSSHYKICLMLNPTNNIDKDLECKMKELTNNTYYFYLYFYEKCDQEKIKQIKKWDNLYDYDGYMTKVDEYLQREQRVEENFETIIDENGESHEYDHNSINDYEDLERHFVRVYKFIKNKMYSELKKHRDEIFSYFRAYLKTEWERIKHSINGCEGEFNFEESFNHIIGKEKC